MAAADALYREQAAIIEQAVTSASKTWRDLDPNRLNASWVEQQIGGRLELDLARSQELAAMAADVYTDLILLEQGGAVAADGELIPGNLAGVASDGRDLEGLLLQPLITSHVATSRGLTGSDALAAGLKALARIVGTQVADTGRAAQSVGIAARPRTGYVRLVESKACSRCVILAGRWYRFSDGFDRHYLCKCRNIPASEDTNPLTTASDPMTNFKALSEAEQNKQFTKAGAQAIRDGADINQVVNSRRGAMGLSTPGRVTAAERKAIGQGGRIARTDVYGKQLFITSEGTTKRGVAGLRLIEQSGARRSRESSGNRTVYRSRSAVPRLMPESIYEIAEDQADAVRLLRVHGYLK